MTNDELLGHATRFTFKPTDDTRWDDEVHVLHRGGDRWIVSMSYDRVVNKDGRVEYDTTLNSERTDSFTGRTRFSRDEAIQIAIRFCARVRQETPNTRSQSLSP